MDLSPLVAQGMTTEDICLATGRCLAIVRAWLRRQGLRARVPSIAA